MRLLLWIARRWELPSWLVRALAGMYGVVMLALGGAMLVCVLSFEALNHVPTQQIAATFHLKPTAQCRADPGCLRKFVNLPPEPPAVHQLDAVQAPQASTLVVPHLAGTSSRENARP